ncbi:hypothetical protein QOZ80_7BG0584570 [Eleusine coracana subsp. coracana]|nr:hypothetical protein QOZ80_7BG0584570 [Eleusine coracana subsp. coracana]
MILDMQELVMFLTCYPRLYQQPYSMHLLLDNCMFGRQMEAETVINFVLYTQPHGAEELLDVLPIVGPGGVGKSTLVSHVLKDERVCNHFSEILFSHDCGFTDDELAVSFRQVCAARNHQNHASNSNKDGRSLVVVELAGDFNEDAWNRLYSASKRSMPTGSKIIVTSRSENITRFGTTRALCLDHLSHETYWYLFKTLAFGSMHPEAYPRHMHLAMEIASSMNRCFISAIITARLLRDNFDIHFWYKVMACLRGFIQTHVSSFGEHPFDLVVQNRPARFGRMGAPSEYFMIYKNFQLSSDEEVPELRIQDLMYGSVKPYGKFEILIWQSHILPYHSYVATCEIQEQKIATSKRKRSA